MEFGQFMLNLCIGIVSGAFSSIIISRVFLVLSTYNEQVTRIQEHIENSRIVSGMLRTYLYIDDNVARSVDIFSIEELNKSVVKQVKEKAKQECERFDSMIFDDLDDDLRKVTTDLSHYMIHLSMLTEVNKEGVIKITDTLKDIHSRFTQYKSNRRSYFVKAILKDKWLWWTAGIFFVIVVVTIFTNVDICSLFAN